MNEEESLQERSDMLSPPYDSESDPDIIEIETVNNSLHLLDLHQLNDKDVQQTNNSVLLNDISRPTRIWMPKGAMRSVSKIIVDANTTPLSYDKDNKKNTKIKDKIDSCSVSLKEGGEKSKESQDLASPNFDSVFLEENENESKRIKSTITMIAGSEFQEDLKSLYLNQIDFLQRALCIEKKRNHQYQKRLTYFQTRIFDLQKEKANDKSSFKEQLIKVQQKLEALNGGFLKKTSEMKSVEESFQREKELSKTYSEKILEKTGQILELEASVKRQQEELQLVNEKLMKTKEELGRQRKENFCLKAEKNILNEEKILLEESRERMKRECIQAKEEMYRLDKLIYGKRDGRKKGTMNKIVEVRNRTATQGIDSSIKDGDN